MDRYYAYALDGFARGFVKAELNRGIPLAELHRETERTGALFRKAFNDHREKFKAHLSRIHSDLAQKTWERVVGMGVDTRLHPTLKTLLKRGLNFEAVERARVETFGNRLKESLEMALKDAQQL